MTSSTPMTPSHGHDDSDVNKLAAAAIAAASAPYPHDDEEARTSPATPMEEETPGGENTHDVPDIASPSPFSMTPDEVMESPLSAMPMMSVGEHLRAAREASGYTINEVAAEVKIKPQHLLALEEGDYGHLPSRTYAVGFVRAYAHALGLPVEEMAALCRQEVAQLLPAGPRVAAMPEPESVMEAPLPSASLVVLCVGLAFVAYALGYSFLRATTENVAPLPPPAQVSQTPAETPAAAPPVRRPPTAAELSSTPAAPPVNAPVNTSAPAASTTPPMAVQISTPQPSPAAAVSDANPPVEQPEIDTTNVAPGMMKNPASPAATSPVANTAAEPSPAASGAATAPGAKPPPSRIKLRATGETTVQIFDSFGKMIAERVINKGEAFYVPDKPGYTLATTNAGGLKIQVDGRDMPALGGKDEAMHNIPLSADNLLKYLQ
jgi:cytoskeleton protein RodZ